MWLLFLITLKHITLHMDLRNISFMVAWRLLESGNKHNQRTHRERTTPCGAGIHIQKHMDSFSIELRGHTIRQVCFLEGDVWSGTQNSQALKFVYGTLNVDQEALEIHLY